MINDCKNCHSMVYDSAVGWCCSLLKPMKLCEDITQEECPIRRKRYERFQLREALDIVNDRKTMLAEREAQKQADLENAPKKSRKPRKKSVPKKTVEQQVVEAAVKENQEKVEKVKENCYERRANFRGRPKHAPGGWVYGCLERHWYQGQYSYYIVDDDGNETLTDPSSICQDTGMVDDYCNGIWEGDVLDDHDSGEHYMVYWDERLGMWAVKETTTGFTMSLFRFLQTSDAERSDGNP